MDIRMVMIDENGDVLDHLTIYQDGSDSEGVAKIREYLEENFTVEDDNES